MADTHDDSKKDVSDATSKVQTALGRLSQVGLAVNAEEKKEETPLDSSSQEKKEEEKKEGEEKKEETPAPSATSEEKKEETATPAATEEKKEEGEEKKEEEKKEETAAVATEEKKEESKEDKKKKEKEEKEKKEKEKKKKEKEEKEKKEKEEKEKKKKEKEEKNKDSEKSEKKEKKTGFTLRGRKKPAALEEEEKKEGEEKKEEKKEGEEKKEETAAPSATSEEKKEGEEEKKEGEETPAVAAAAATEEKKEGEGSPATEDKKEGEEKKESDSSDDEKEGKEKDGKDKGKKGKETKEASKEPRKKGDFESYLEKRGEIGVVKGWKKRHFRLFNEENKIHYFKNDTDTELIGTIDLASATAFSLGDEKKKEEKKVHHHHFDIKSSNRTWHLRTENKADHEAWVNHLGKSLSLSPSKSESVSENKEVSPKASTENVAVVSSEEHQEKTEKAEATEETSEVKKEESEEGEKKEEKKEESGKDELAVEASTTTDSFVPAKEEEEEPLPQRELHAGDVALFIYKDNQTSSVSEVRNVFVGEDGTSSIEDFPTSLVAKTLSFRSLSDANASLASASFPTDPTVSKKEPKLQVTVDTELRSQDHLVELLYQTKSGLSYAVEYNAVLGANDKSVQFSGHYSLANSTGKNYKNANVFLVSTGIDKGESENAPAPTQRMARSLSIKNLGLQKAFAASSEKKAEKEPVYKTITTLLPKPVHLENDSNTNVKFVSASFPVKPENLIYSVPATFVGGETNTERDFHSSTATFQAQKVISFANNKENHLGLDLPAGVLTVSRRQKDGFGALHVASTNLKGEESGKTLFVEIGSLPGVSLTRKVTKFDHDKRSGKLTETFELTVQNNTNAVVTLTVVEAAYRGRNFELVNSSGWTKGTDADSDKLSTNATVKSHDKKVLTYSVAYAVPVELKK